MPRPPPRRRPTCAAPRAPRPAWTRPRPPQQVRPPPRSRPPPAAPPAGWREKGSGGMPRWLYRTIYGEEPPATQGEATEEDAAGDDPAQDG